MSCRSQCWKGLSTSVQSIPRFWAAHFRPPLVDPVKIEPLGGRLGGSAPHRCTQVDRPHDPRRQAQGFVRVGASHIPNQGKGVSGNRSPKNRIGPANAATGLGRPLYPLKMKSGYRGLLNPDRFRRRLQFWHFVWEGTPQPGQTSRSLGRANRSTESLTASSLRRDRMRPLCSCLIRPPARVHNAGYACLATASASVSWCRYALAHFPYRTRKRDLFRSAISRCIW